ncbi:Rrf2 family transcriptional regulator [Candidatus Falkowbacteria bacterium]|nr:Rrf2 family transcriptional regulator [Candidatus Falkowbacteria bacterium]
MKFSTRAEYGLRAIVHLDKNGRNLVSLAGIAQKEKLSLAYLERLFAKLKKAKLVRADLGARGGYYLAKPAKKINVLSVIEALEGSVAPMECVGRDFVCCSAPCRVHPVWLKLYRQIKKTLKEISLESIM